MKYTTIAVKSYNKEKILKYSKQKKLSQNDLIELCIDIAEKVNFDNEYPIISLRKFQREETNRIIGFIKTQDKNLVQMEQNLYHFFENQKAITLDNFLKIVAQELKKKIYDEISDKENAKNTFNRIFEMIVAIKEEAIEKEKI